jgi:hypothetical protein
MKRFLILITPDKRSTLVISALGTLSFVLALVCILQKDVAGMNLYTGVSLGLFTYLFVLKFIAAKAALDDVAEVSKVVRKLKQEARQQPAAGESRGLAAYVEEERKEKRELEIVLANMESAYRNIPADSPAKQRYAATIEMVKRTLGR